MEITLKIKDDQLNKEIKKLAKNHLKSIVRSEVVGLVGEELDKKIQLYDKKHVEISFNKKIEQEIKNVIRPQRYNHSGIVGNEIKNQIKVLVNAELKKHTESIGEIVSQLAQNRLQELLDKYKTN